ncbi:serine/threonine-protein kinase VRK1-like [Littorina saxatilis]|uniref:non-specific serine/threonine protein kinase n=1 Tax=Littorina saxatilis TaxID=31220 RepID=A0AAN9BE71_9CAEN
MPRARAGSAGAKKGRGPKAHKLPEKFPPGEVLFQPSEKKTWLLGDVIGQGGFGLIYKASDMTAASPGADPDFVIKIEPQDNGPLFCELHFYQRCAKPDMIREWTKAKKLKYLGVPPFLGTGLHKKGDKQYRFLAMPRLGTDLQKLFEDNNRAFSEKTVYSVGLRMLDALEYIHEKGYCHGDIKAANILLGHSDVKGVDKGNQVYLVDYGLAYRFLVDDVHKEYKEDPKRAHDGTAEYTSRDAHNGVYPARRGDLEILGYCMLEWLAGKLPWSNDLNNKDRVRDLKMQYMNDVPGLMKACFGSGKCPEGVKKYLSNVSKLAYDKKPDYNQLRQLLCSGAQNEWTLGLSEGAKGTKRKNESEDLVSPKAQKVRGRSAPSPSQKPAGPKGSAAKGVKRKSDSGDMGSSSSSPEPSGEPDEITNGAAKAKRSKPAATNGKPKPSPAKKAKPAAPAKVAGTASASAVKIQGAAKRRGRPAKVTPGGSKSPAKKAVSSPSMAKVKARTPQKAAVVRRKRNKVAVTDSAVQTSPGFGLLANGGH